MSTRAAIGCAGWSPGLAPSSAAATLAAAPTTRGEVTSEYKTQPASTG
jgi:hypothetical protein